VFVSRVLAQIPAAPAAVVVFRNILIKPDGEPDDPFEPDPEYAGGGGRWDTDGRTLYTATKATVSWAEWCRNHPAAVAEADPTGGQRLEADLIKQLAWQDLPDKIPARALVHMTFDFVRLVDLTTSKAQQRLVQVGFDPNDLYADDYGRCPQLARDFEALGADAIKVPSAAFRNGECIAVFSAGRQCRGDWEPVQRRARPGVPEAMQTVYKKDETPAWILGENAGAPQPLAA
jgi:hypothetical protein